MGFAIDFTNIVRDAFCASAMAAIETDISLLIKDINNLPPSPTLHGLLEWTNLSPQALKQLNALLKQAGFKSGILRRIPYSDDPEEEEKYFGMKFENQTFILPLQVKEKAAVLIYLQGEENLELEEKATAEKQESTQKKKMGIGNLERLKAFELDKHISYFLPEGSDIVVCRR